MGPAAAARVSVAAGLLLLLLFGTVSAQGTTSSPWTPVSIVQDGPSPPPSMSHASGALRNGTSLVVFGGCTSSCCFAPIDQLWELRLDPTMGLSAGNWRPLTPSGGDENNRPGPRFSAATAVDPAADALYMYGGQDSSQVFLSELWKLELDTAGVAQARWTRLRTPRLHTPPPRGAASLTLLGGQYLLLYGGFGRDGARNDAWLLDLAHSISQGWQRLAVKGGAGDDAPPHRWHHTVVAVGGQTVVVVGGSDEAGTDAGDAWTLEVDVRAGTAVWAPLVDAAAGGGIPPRHGHAALRTAATAGVASFVVFGGVNTTADTLPASFLGDAYRLDVAAGKWAPVEGGDAEKGAGGPGARAYAAVGHGAGHSVVFGGFAGYTGDVDDRLLGDVWVFRHGGVQGGLEEGVGAEVVASE